MSTVDVDFPEGLGQLALFADLPRDELEAIVESCERVSYREGEWVIRQGDDLSALYMIIDGEVTTVIDDVDVRILPKGSFFGEVSVLLDEPTSASIVTRSPVTCLVVPAPEVESFLLSHPRVLYRMLKAEARRLRTASEISA
jgi:CRP-like cAMP-binding protein